MTYGKTYMILLTEREANRLEELNRCTGDWVKQKIKTVPVILLDLRR